MLNSSNEDKSEKIQENMLLPRTTNLMVEWFRQISDQFWPIQSFQFCKSVFHFQKLCIFGLLYFWLLIKYYIPYFINSNYRTARSYIGPHREVQYWNIGPRASHSALYFNIEPLGSVQYSFFSSCPIISQLKWLNNLKSFVREGAKNALSSTPPFLRLMIYTPPSPQVIFVIIYIYAFRDIFNASKLSLFS